MMQELYIDGVLVDIDERLSVSLNIKSNLLGDVSKIAANHTYTMQLPATAHNCAVIGNADALPVETFFPYQYHRADYYRNGTPIIQDGRAVLLSVGETIDIVVTWGVTTPLSQFIAGGASLNDLATGETISYPQSPTFVKWGAFLADTTYAPMYARADFHKPLDNEEQERTAATHVPTWNATYARPCVRVPWLLGKITSQYGVGFDWTQEAQDVLDRLCLPLTKDTPNAQSLTPSTIRLDSWTRSGYAFVYAITLTNTGSVFSSNDGTFCFVSSSKTITLAFDYRVTMDAATAGMMVANTRLQVRITDGTNTDDPEDLQMQYNIIERVGNNAVVEIKGTLDVELASGQGMALVHKADGLLFSVYAIPNSLLGMDVQATNQADHIQFGSPFNVDGNLPDIKIVDFLKTLCSLLGVFPLQPKGNTISFVPFHTLQDNDNYAVDWTTKVVPAYELERPRSTEYHVGEWARKNWLRWKEVDGYEGQSDASVNVADDTLDAERDLYTLPFAPCPMNSLGMARVPIWELNNYDKLMTGEETTPTYSIEACEPRLLLATPYRSKRFINTGDDSTKDVMLTMDGLKFADVVNNKYQTLTGLLNSARVITERVRLNDTDLLTFDESVPVYLSQYGTTFAVLEINADEDGFADVKMIKL